jgi:hypothetical protein
LGNDWYPRQTDSETKMRKLRTAAMALLQRYGKA